MCSIQSRSSPGFYIACSLPFWPQRAPLISQHLSWFSAESLLQLHSHFGARRDDRSGGIQHLQQPSLQLLPYLMGTEKRKLRSWIKACVPSPSYLRKKHIQRLFKEEFCHTMLLKVYSSYTCRLLGLKATPSHFSTAPLAQAGRAEAPAPGHCSTVGLGGTEFCARELWLLAAIPEKTERRKTVSNCPAGEFWFGGGGHWSVP